jgi:precorrin-2 dehydrogenase/sirohydrochlorin ferrochelatase
MSLLVAWQLKDKRVLIVGGGEIASQRMDSILVTDASIAVIAPEHRLNSRARQLIACHHARITHHDRLFLGPSELHNIDMVLTALDDPERSREIVLMCRDARIPVNAADIPDLCDFYFGAQIRDGPLQIMISTNGNGPRLASRIKERLQRALSGGEGEAITKVGRLRTLLKQKAPGIGGDQGRRRMKWMTRLCNEWELEDFAQLDDAMMKSLLEDGWEKDRILSLQDVGGTCSTRRYHQNFHSTIPLAVGFFVGVFTTALITFFRHRK